jgi:hypothetical protein
MRLRLKSLAETGTDVSFSLKVNEIEIEKSGRDRDRRFILIEGQ